MSMSMSMSMSITIPSWLMWVLGIPLGLMALGAISIGVLFLNQLWENSAVIGLHASTD